MDERHIAYETLVATRESALWMFWAMIGTWVAGIMTLLAVITSLYIALRKPKIYVGGQIRYSWLMTNTEDIPVVSITVVNKSQYPIKLKAISWSSGKGRNAIEFQQMFRGHFSDNLPIRLEHGEEANFRIPIKDEQNGWILRMAQRIKEKKSDINKLHCIVKVSTGERFRIDISKNIKKKISDAMHNI